MCSVQEREPKRVEPTVEVESGIVFAQLAGAGGAAQHHDMFELSLSKALQGNTYTTLGCMGYHSIY